RHSRGGGGVVFSSVMERPLTPENASTGPIVVAQIIGRFDGPVSYEGFLDQVRQRSINEDGYQLVPGAPNDGGTASLVRVDGAAAAYQVGFIKRNMVIFTTAIGNKDVITLQGVLDLAGVSSARVDQVLAVGSAPPPTQEPVAAVTADAPPA